MGTLRGLSVAEKTLRTISFVLAYLAALAIFLSTWWHCASTYSFLLRFCLGWVPAAIIAGGVGVFVYFAWGLVLGFAVLCWAGAGLVGLLGLH